MMISSFRTKPMLVNNATNSTVVLEHSSYWRTIMDNFMVEFMASLFLLLITVFCWNPANTLLQFAPPLAMGLILLCLKDEVAASCFVLPFLFSLPACPSSFFFSFLCPPLPFLPARVSLFLLLCLPLSSPSFSPCPRVPLPSSFPSPSFSPSVSLFLLVLPPLCVDTWCVQDYFFPDGAWFVTLVLWALGGYGSWMHVVARLLGQTASFAVAFWIVSVAQVPDIIHYTHQPLSIVFFMEMFGTMLEHLAIVYVVMPLLPTPVQHHGFLFPKVKPKSDHATKAPSNPVVMHSALTFSALHWVLWRGLNVEMNPAISLVLAFLRAKQDALHAEAEWHHVTIAVWGQIVGIALCITYTALYFPRESKMWRLSA